MLSFLVRRLALLKLVVFPVSFGLVVENSLAGIINVALGNRSTYSMTNKWSNDSSQSSLSGTAAPLAYSGNTWNQFSTLTPSAANLLTSDGVTTSVSFDVTGYKDSPGDHGGVGILDLLGAGLHSDGPSTSGGFNPSPNTLPSLNITGLNDSWTYRLVIVSGGNYNNSNEWNIGGTPTFSDPNTPSGFIGGISQFSASDTNQRSSWVKDVNYVIFEDLQSVGGVLTVKDRAINDKFSINGFQLEGSAIVPEPTSMAIFGLGAISMAFRARRNRVV